MTACKRDDSAVDIKVVQADGTALCLATFYTCCNENIDEQHVCQRVEFVPHFSTTRLEYSSVLRVVTACRASVRRSHVRRW